MIVDAAWYVEGRRTLETDSIEKLAAERGGAGFGWLGLRMPTDAELDEARDAFDLPELAIADARNKHDRPKVERHEGCLLTVVPTARYVDEREEVEFGELFFYAGPDYIVTVRYGHAAPLAGVRHELEDEHSDRLAHGPGAVLQAALLHVVQSYVPVIDGLEHDVREIERAVFSERREQPTKRIYFLIREVLDFLVALEPMSASVKRLTSMECNPWVHPEIVPLFRDVDDALSEIVERGRTVHQLLNNASDGQPHRGLAAPERGHPPDLGVGGDRRDPDRHRRTVRDEPRRHPRRRSRSRLRHRRAAQHPALRHALPPLQGHRLALTACTGTNANWPSQPTVVSRLRRPERART